MPIGADTWWNRIQRTAPLAWLNGVALVAAVSLFLLIANRVAEGDHWPLEEAIMHSLRAGEPSPPAGPPWLVSVARDITALGSVVVLSTIAMLAIGFLALSRRFGAALFLFVAATGGQSLNAALKWYFGRERPDPAFRWIEIDSPSFPSGHAASSAVVYLAIAVLLARLAENRRQKIYLIGSALALSFCVGLTRVYLGVHYPTDVIAGWTVGVAWAQVCWFAARAIGRARLALVRK